MRTLLHIILLSLCATFAHAQSLHFKYGRSQNVSVKQLDINLEVANNIVRTTITADFSNSRNWRQEGELIVPLPPGATISAYELEIDGKMRKASVVEKERALRAYEEIKARNVDPGLVEKKANNHFRIRVFPIPAGQTKKTKLSFVYRLPKVADTDHYLYQLPISLTEKVEKLNITVSGDCDISANKIAFKSDNGKQSYRSEDNLLEDIIKLTIPYSNKPTLTLEPTENGEQVHALYSLPVPKNLPLTRPYTPEKITLLWDTSDVGNDRNLPAELNLLEQYFQHNRNTQVTLHTTGYTTQSIGTYDVVDADWKKLQSALQSLHYDGAASLNLTTKTPDAINPSAFIILVSSNKPQIHHLSTLLPQLKIINSTQNFETDSLLKDLTQQHLTVISKHPGTLLTSADPQLLHYFITSPKESLSISIGYGNEVKHTFKIENKHIQKTIRSPLKTIIAQENLLRLQQTHAPKNVIIDFCKKHRLTSDYTSMIVLESLRDYLTYQIEPQDPTMLEHYKQVITTPSPNSRTSNRMVRNRKAPQKTYLWHLQSQLPAIDNIETFKLAADRFFLKDQYSTAPMVALDSWKNELATLKETRRSIDTQPEYMQWIENVSKLDAQRRHFFSEKVNWPKDKDIFVSLRGKVPEQKVHQLKPNTDLRAFLQNYELQSVALYRNSHRKIYNLTSDAYQKTPLQTGDMLVALEKRDIYFDEEDNPRDQPFITDNGNDLSTSIKYDSYSLYGGADGFGADPFSDGGESQYIGSAPEHPSFINKNISPTELRKTNTSPDAWKKFENSANQNAQKAYLQLKSNSRQNHHFYTHAARILYAHNKPEIARKVLSNIIAGEEHKFTAKKRHLLWLIELQDYQHAIELIKSYDPNLTNLTNHTVRYLLTKAHLLNHSLTDELKQKLTKDFQHLGLDDLIEFHSNKPKRASYDIHITAVAETNGISKLLKVDYKDSFTNGLPPLNIYRQGLHCITSPGVSTCTMHEAIPGEYRVSIVNDIIATYQIEIVRFWGTPNVTTKRITIQTDGTSKWKEINHFTHQFPAE